MRVLITGAAGFIGSHVADLLIEHGHEVKGLDNFTTGRPENFPAARCDITNHEDLFEYFTDFRPQAVVHLAAQPAISTSWNNPDWDAMVNIMGTLKLLRIAKAFKEVERFIFASTSAVYKPSDQMLTEDSPLGPESPYGVSKLAAEGYVRNLFPKGHVILRFANVYGPRQIPLGENQVVPRMIKHLLKGDDFCIHGDGEQKRDFVYVKDVARAVECAVTGYKTGTFNISTGVPTSINVLASLVESVTNNELHVWKHSDTEDPRRMVRMNPYKSLVELSWNPTTAMMIPFLRDTFEWWKEKA